MEVSTTALRFPEYYTYSCQDGYTTTDDMVVFCLKNGSLSMSEGPSCTAVPTGIYLVYAYVTKEKWKTSIHIAMYIKHS